MKKPTMIFPVILVLGVMFIFCTCYKTKQVVLDCTAFGGPTVKTERNPLDSTALVTLTIYSAFTPDNIAFCDSNNFFVDKRTGNVVTPPGLCRPNPDSIYNDRLNQYLYIAGIENFPYNDLRIRVQGDTTNLDTLNNYSNNLNGHREFTGVTVDTTLHGFQRQRILTSGKYVFILQLYKDKYHTQRIDSIHGYFCLIRNPKVPNIGCQGHDPNDPLIK